VAQRHFDDGVRECDGLVRPGLSVARNPWAVIGLPVAGSLQRGVAPAFMRRNSVSSAILGKGCPRF
jgi:hypothetical protein